MQIKWLIVEKTIDIILPFVSTSAAIFSTTREQNCRGKDAEKVCYIAMLAASRPGGHERPSSGKRYIDWSG